MLVLLKARMVYNLFQMITKFGREMIDRIRLDEADQLREDKPTQRTVKRSLLMHTRKPEGRSSGRSEDFIGPELAANAGVFQSRASCYARAPSEPRSRWIRCLNSA